jgi:hypothetical protein
VRAGFNLFLKKREMFKIMKRIWIIGAGRMGLKAAKVLIHKNPGDKITLVDKTEAICKNSLKPFFKMVCMDGVLFINENLTRPDYPDWIIPAVPLHLAYEWIRFKLSKEFRLQTIPVPDKLVATLPNPFRGDAGQVYISNADFICPSNCPEPDEICTHTGKPRPRILHDFLESIQYDDFRSVVVKSQQLSNGIGGYTSKALFKALEQVEKSRPRVLLSTACRCHGVMHAIKFL